MSDRPKPLQDEKGRFIAGNGGNGGRPKGSRNKLGEAFVSALYEDFQEHGKATIEAVRAEDPAAYVRVLASILPKELNVNHNTLGDLTDDELDALLALLPARRGDQGEDRSRAETAH